jgi:hypothetical protein
VKFKTVKQLIIMFEPKPQTITQADIDAVNTQIDDLVTAIKALNTTNTALTEKERKDGVTVSVRRKAFLDYYFANKDANGAFKPSQTLIPEADAVKHYFVHTNTGALIGKLFSAVELLQDMELNGEHYTFNFASAGLDAAAKARKNGLPGADSWYDALKNLFPKVGRKGSRGVVNPPATGPHP